MMLIIAISIHLDWISRKEDLQDFRNLRRISEGNEVLYETEKDLEEFAKNSYFDSIRFITVVIFLISAAFMINQYLWATVLCGIALVLSVLLYSIPWALRNEKDQQQAWLLLVKHLAAIGGVLLLMTRGIERGVDQRVSFFRPGGSLHHRQQNDDFQ